ncbi:hypothetical protein TBLA_0J00930 [Henningerozyma blattae CBS 6284]|uniref:AN1-type domain-containing protein n=1 Tax=Henningerozyma blattae (strain ATCC 34711 / CBS 6284 / DSM 70876 / NBRC 10599 / NRRL Y-10934 / UCD 77-7) TaxID=1071380 RepID=I2H9N9_HENB6|nr:hypothetical protein TBLA_0J00930 [Tetrapisispora blattae CBS 6284]CCH63091.1 hypothetical protein TBLA_0J00930 [Tetrapisispora blattae CBS 6284]
MSEVTRQEQVNNNNSPAATEEATTPALNQESLINTDAAPIIKQPFQINNARLILDDTITSIPNASPNLPTTSVKTTCKVTKKKGNKRRKNQCYYGDCSSTISKFIGNCKFCNKNYCSKHRLMEIHDCRGLKSCRDQMHKRNAEKLASEQTKSPKIQI